MVSHHHLLLKISQSELEAHHLKRCILRRRWIGVYFRHAIVDLGCPNPPLRLRDIPLKLSGEYLEDGNAHL